MRRVSLVIVTVLLAACAAKPPPMPVTQVPAAPADWTAEQLLAAQRAGYSLVTRNGEQVLCRQDPQTGSRLQRNTICMTTKEWQRTRGTSRDTLQDLTRGQQPACALEKNC